MFIVNIEQLKSDLKNYILDFWTDKAVDNVNGGFYGRISEDMSVDAEYDRASVLYSRILWTFSTAYIFFNDDRYLAAADRAYAYIVEHFIDSEFSGVYWMLDYKGNVVNPKKQVYATAFAIYGLSQYYLATGKEESLKKALELYIALEKYAYDRSGKGYLEALAQDWSPLEDMSLSVKDMNAPKSMNTHLHVLEAYTNLFRAWDSNVLRHSLEELIKVTIERIVDQKSARFLLFFDDNWTPLSNIDSYGHDIEGSWLIYEAACVLGDRFIQKKAADLAVEMAQHVYDFGIDPEYGGIYNESGNDSGIGRNKDWWPQAEAAVGFLNAYELSGKKHFLNAFYDIMDFIDKNIIDRANGEWRQSVSRDLSVILPGEKVGPWKCPYHNSRMYFEILRRKRGDGSFVSFRPVYQTQ